MFNYDEMISPGGEKVGIENQNGSVALVYPNSVSSYMSIRFSSWKTNNKNMELTNGLDGLDVADCNILRDNCLYADYFHNPCDQISRNTPCRCASDRNHAG